MKKEREYKVTIYNDRIKVQYNIKDVFKTTKIKRKVLPTKKKNDEHPFMTKLKYTKTLKRYRNKLYDLDIIAEKSVFITLTTNNSFVWNELKLKLQAFILCIKRNFGKIFYIRAIESQNKGIHFHIHLIIMFENSIPNDFNKLWIEKHWKQGFIDFKKVKEPYGIIDYFTTFKSENINPDDDNYTKIPEFVQIITYSADFPKAEKKEIITNETEMTEIIDNFKDTNEKAFVYSEGHKYVDKNTGELGYCLDRQYIHIKK